MCLSLPSHFMVLFLSHAAVVVVDFFDFMALMKLTQASCGEAPHSISGGNPYRLPASNAADRSVCRVLTVPPNALVFVAFLAAFSMWVSKSPKRTMSTHRSIIAINSLGR